MLLKYTHAWVIFVQFTPSIIELFISQILPVAWVGHARFAHGAVQLNCVYNEALIYLWMQPVHILTHPGFTSSNSTDWWDIYCPIHYRVTGN